MEALTFFSAMNRGQFREEQGDWGQALTVSFCPDGELVTQVSYDRKRGPGRAGATSTAMKWLPGALRVRQVGSECGVEESTTGGVSRLPGGEAGQVHRTTADVRASVQNTGSLPAH